MFDTSEKKERSLGAKLFLKAERCASAKCAMVRRPSRPGVHGKRRRRGALSEYGRQFQEKQKIKFSYGIREKQMRRVFSAASRNPGVTGKMIMVILEQRLDNVVFRLGLAPSRSVSRQLINHGHVLVNGKKVKIASRQVRVGDIIAIRPQSRNHPLFKDLNITLKKFEPPIWLNIDKDKLEGKVVSLPNDLEIPFDVNLVVDYYSK